MFYVFHPFRDLPSGIPNMTRSGVPDFRNWLLKLTGELEHYSASYQGVGFQFDGGLLLVLPVYVAFMLFQEPDLYNVKISFKTAMEGIWARIPGSGKLLLPH